MRYIEAPAYYQRDAGDRTVFLAGGITGVQNWQAEAVEMFGDVPAVVFNPRQPAFDVTNSGAAAEQIAWEVAHLRQADVTLFWFPRCDPAVTVQPIALFELGMTLGDARNWGRRLVVGAAPDYPRRFDVVEQCRHALPCLKVHQYLNEVVSDALVELAVPGATTAATEGDQALHRIGDRGELT